MIGKSGFAGLLIVPILYLIPAVILYFIIKFAVKNAIKELKNEGLL